MTGMSRLQAEEIISGLLKQAKEEAQKDGTIDLPPNLGDILLQKEFTDKNVKTMLEKRRKEGVRNEDIRWWYNMHELERRMMLKFDEYMRLVHLMNLTDQGVNEKEAVKRLRKTHPMFGDPEDTSRTTGEDRPLPYELKDRINIFIEKIAKSSPADLEKYKKEIEESSSYNAFVREQIRKGST
jgi:uncharacterized protein with GYD domain